MTLKDIYEYLKRHKIIRNKTIGRNVSAQHCARRSADSDRSDIRVFEEGLAIEQNCDWALGSRKAQESFSLKLIEIAKKANLYLTKEECTELGEFVPILSGESKIYENAAQGLVYKVRNPFAKIHLKNQDLRYILYEHIIHNILFPETRYSFIGVTEDNGTALLIYSQKLFFDCNSPTQKQIETRLREIGLEPESYYYYGNEYVSVTDVNDKSDNVMLSGTTILFIDPIIKIKKDPIEVIKHLLGSKL